MLHLALARYIDDQENFGVYKEILKEILQYGAERNLKNRDGYTPEMLVMQYKERIRQQEPEEGED